MFFRAVFSLVDVNIPAGTGGEADLMKIFEYIGSRDLPNVGGVAFSAVGPFKITEVKQALGVTD